MLGNIGSTVMATCLAGGNAFYARAASTGATEEAKFFAPQSRSAEIGADGKTKNEVAGGITDLFTGIVRAFPHCYMTIALTMQLRDHLINVGASNSALQISGLATRYLPVLPMLVPVAPVVIGMFFANNGGQAVEGASLGRTIQKAGRYGSRAIELATAALLVSRVVKNDGRITAAVGLAVLVVGLVQRHELLKTSAPAVQSKLDAAFTWKPSVVPYALGATALIAGPSRPMALFMIFFQGMRDLVLSSAVTGQTKQSPKPKA